MFVTADDTFSVSDNMWLSRLWKLPLVIFLLAEFHDASRVPDQTDNSIQTSVFLSPPFFLRPGSVVSEFLFNIPFPRGHIALKSFDAEIVDEMGVPVPLHEAYIHHWSIYRYHRVQESRDEDKLSNVIIKTNSGMCNGPLDQYFGLGSETRRTSTWVPNPYGIEIGDPKAIPNGYEERWVLDIHAIDTRGVKDRLGCSECKCSLYNVTKDESGYPLRKNYIGGINCCYDKTQCQLREGFDGGEIRKLYLRYSVKWAQWDESIIPVKIYILDVTDTGRIPGGASSSCKIEYQVDQCAPQTVHSGKCVDTKKARVIIPKGGDIVYAVGHQHSGGLGSSVYGQDGRVLCTSMPTYGNGNEAGNEEGYVVGMSTCYPEPGAVKIEDGEFLTIESNYNNSQMHTGVMGFFYLMIAEPQTEPKSVILFPNLSLLWRQELTKCWPKFLLVGGVVAIIIAISYSRRYDEGYLSL